MAAFPSTPLPGTAKLTILTPTLISTSQSLKQQVRSRGGQRLKVDLSWDKRTRALMAPIMAAVAALRGQYNTCTLVVPGYTDSPQGTWAGAAALDGANQSGRSINLKGLTAGATIKAGDFFTIAGDLKVYMAAADGTANGSGKIASLAIEPALMVTSLADGALLTSSNVAVTAALVSDNAEFPIESPLFVSLSLSFVERV